MCLYRLFYSIEKILIKFPYIIHIEREGNSINQKGIDYGSEENQDLLPSEE